MAWRVTVRDGPKVERIDMETLSEALEELEMQARAAANTTRRNPVDVKIRTFQPSEQVAVRVELSGPRRVRGGVDVHGDGSVQAYTGRLRRRAVEPERRQTPYEALRRALSSVSVEP